MGKVEFTQGILDIQPDAGMELLAAYDAFTKEPVKEDSERIYVVARPRR